MYNEFLFLFTLQACMIRKKISEQLEKGFVRSVIWFRNARFVRLCFLNVRLYTYLTAGLLFMQICHQIILCNSYKRTLLEHS